MDRAKNVKSELECFNLFMDPSIITDIPVRTNRRISSLLESFTPAKRTKMKIKNVYASETCEEEIKAYIGLSFLRPPNLRSSSIGGSLPLEVVCISNIFYFGLFSELKFKI